MKFGIVNNDAITQQGYSKHLNIHMYKLVYMERGKQQTAIKVAITMMVNI